MGYLLLMGKSSLWWMALVSWPVSSHLIYQYTETWGLIGLINVVCSFASYNIIHSDVGMQVKVVLQPSKSWNTDRFRIKSPKLLIFLTHSLHSVLSIVDIITLILLYRKKKHRLNSELPSMLFRNLRSNAEHGRVKFTYPFPLRICFPRQV